MRTGQCALAESNYGEAQLEALSRLSVTYRREELGQNCAAAHLL